MSEQLSDYCDVAWDAVLTATCLEAEIAARKVTAAPPASVENMIGVYRLPRTVLTEAIQFTEEHAATCLQSRRDLPTMPIDDPWSRHRRDSLERRICACIDRVASTAEQNWGVPKQTSAVSKSAAKYELLREVAQKWEDGMRTYHRALMACNAVGPSAGPSPNAAKNGEPRKCVRKRGQTTEERLKDLFSSEEGRQSILAAGTGKRIGRLIDRSHGAVAGSDMWDEEIKPMLDAMKAVRKLARYEMEERRQDRRQK